MQWLKGLTPDQRRAMVFALAYERVRRNQGHFGYRIFPELAPAVLELHSFKTCLTVVLWLDQTGWKISWSEIHWQGYIKYAFRELRPTIPHVGQLKNMRLLRSYLASAPDDWEPPQRSSADLDRIYRKVLDPELATTSMLAALGLRPQSE